MRAFAVLGEFLGGLIVLESFKQPQILAVVYDQKSNPLMVTQSVSEEADRISLLTLRVTCMIPHFTLRVTCSGKEPA